jgi:hypothetical protein
MTHDELNDPIFQQLPRVTRCDRVDLRNGDVLIHAPGFEDRTMAIFDIIAPVPSVTALLLDYRPHNPNNRLLDVQEKFKQHGISSDVLVYDRFDPSGFEDVLRNVLLKRGTSRAIVDISTMSKLAIILILQVCLRLELDVIVLYTEAQKYGPTQEEFEKAKGNHEIHRPSIQIFTAIHGVVRVSSLASVSMQGQPTAALSFMSFNDVLTQALLNTVFPTRLFLINGRPPVHSWREEATAWIHDQVRREWEDDNPVTRPNRESPLLPERTVSTLDYRETVSLLLHLYWQLSATHRIILAPAGSKMQAVGCFLVKALHPDIHIEYPSPEGFLPEYSSGISQHWIVNFGGLKRTIDAISVEEQREFLQLSTT